MTKRVARLSFRRAAVIAVLAIVALFAASRYWYVRFALADGRTAMVWLGGVEAWGGSGPVAGRPSGFTAGRIARNDRLRTTWWFYADLRRRWHVAVPIWALAAVPGAPLALIWGRSAVRRRRGRCGPCGYDLSGNTSGLCPECGAGIGR